MVNRVTLLNLTHVGTGSTLSMSLVGRQCKNE